MKKTRVLIVEDDADVASFLSNQLRKIGYEVLDYAVSGEEAIKFIGENELPDLIFMDIYLRGKKNGIDTALEIYKIAKLPVVFTSAPENIFLLEDAKFIKSSAFLSKPFDMAEIEKSINSLEEDAIKSTPEYIEAERLRTLNNYEILDTPREGNFDRITKLAALLLNVPVALVSIVDADRIWFKSRYGFREKEIPINNELFTSSFLSKRFEHMDRTDERALINPLLASDSGFEFYASAPLITMDGHNLGTLCVLDRKPREITEKEKKILTDLAEIVIDEMEMRLAARKAYRLQRDFLNTAVHDLKNPLSAVLGFSDISKKEENIKTLHEYNGYIKQAADKMLEIVEGLLKTSLMEMDQIKLDCIPVHFSEIIDSVMAGNKIQAQKKKQMISVNIIDNPIINADPIKLGEALDNLVSNAIKYSPKEEEIEIIVKQASGKAYFEVKDNGPGLTEDEQERVFEKFSRLSAQPTGGETSTGLGLSISKKLVEMHGGVIKAESEGNQKGSTFSVEMPLASIEEQAELEHLHEKA